MLQNFRISELPVDVRIDPAPRGTPPEIVRRINADINRQLADPEVLEQLQRFGFEPAPGTPQQLADTIRADEKKFAELVRRTGATAD